MRSDTPRRNDASGRASRIGASPVKPFLVVLAAALAVTAFGTAAPASAATPCWKAVINDWFDGQIDHVYPKACYYAALGHLPKDVDYYSSAKEDILAALAAQQRNPKPVDYQSGSNGGGSGPNSSGGSPSGGSSEGSSKGVITRAIEWLGPSNADAGPLPLLILAAVALLLAAAGGSVVQKRVQARRLPPSG